MAIDKEAVAANYSDLPIPDLASRMKELKEEIEAKDRALKDLKAEFDVLRIEVVPAKMEEFGTSSMNIRGLGRLTISTDAYITTVKGQKPVLFKWFKDNGFTELLKEDVNPSTLKAWYKEQLAEGNDVPDDDIVNFVPFERASLTKA